MGGRDRGFEIAGVDQLAAHLDLVEALRCSGRGSALQPSRPQVLVLGQDAYAAGLRQARRHLGEVVADLGAGCPLVEAGVLAGLVDPVLAERQGVDAVVRRGGVQANEGVRVEPVAARAGPAIDERELGVGILRRPASRRRRGRSPLPRRSDSPCRSSLLFRASGANQLADALGEDLRVAVHVGLGRRRAHQRHVVEGRQQDAAVERVEVHVAVELGVARGRGPCAVPRHVGPEEVLGAAAEPGHVPGRAVLVDHRLHALGEALAECDHALEGLVGQHLAQARPRRRQRERVAGQGAADAADVRELLLDRVAHPLGDLVGEAVGPDRDAAADRLADREQVGLQPVGLGVAARPRADRVGLVDDQQRAVLAGQLAHRLVVALVGQHDADVGQGRLDEHAGDVAVGQLALERLDVVDLDDAGRLGRVHRRPDVAHAGQHRPPVLGELDEGLVDAAVVAPVLDQDLRAAGDLAAEPDRPAVGVGRRQRELPQRQAEAAAELLPHPARVLVGQHRRDPLGGRAR